MSKNSKNAKNLARAASFTEQRKNGNKGPAKTTPLHGKKWGYRTNPEVAKRIAEMVKATAEAKDKTNGKAILEKAGGASKPTNKNAVKREVRAHVAA